MRVVLKWKMGEILTIPVIVGGRQVPACLDSGANFSFIGRRVAAACGLKALPELVDGSRAVYPATIDVPCADAMVARVTGALLESPDDVFLLGMNVFEQFNMSWCGETKTATIDFLPLSARRVELTRAVRDTGGRLVGSVKEWVSPDQLAQLSAP